MDILKLGILTLLSTSICAHTKTFCHEQDQRKPSMEKEIGRALPSKTGRVGRSRYPSACTMTLISNRCAISAGHCLKNLKLVEFNVPLSQSRLLLGHPNAQDIYEIDQKSIKSRSDGAGNDWAVFKIKKNKDTGLYPGQVQGFLNILKNESIHTLLRITGYGGVYSNVSLHFTQQTDSGEFLSLENSLIRHRVDTQGGNSGSSIIDEASGLVIGIHTHGGCSLEGSTGNSGTYIPTNPELLSAIKSCISSDIR